MEGLKHRENEEWVLAKNAVLGERAAAVGRVLVLALLLVGQSISRFALGEAPPQDSIRTGFIAAYAVFALVTMIAVIWLPPARIIAARLFILVAMPLFDAGFSLAMNLRLVQLTNESAAQRLAPFLAVMLATSLLRSSRWHIVYATGVAAGTYGLYLAFTWSHMHTDHVAGLFICGALLGEGAFLYRATLLVRRMLLDYEKIESVSRFLPPSVARRLREQGEATLQPSSREVTILFSDLRDFTRMSEKLPPTEVMAFLTDYFARMQQVVNGHEGVVNKFIGDGMLAVWGAPDADAEHAKHAVAAALDMRNVVAELNAERGGRGQAPVQIGVGLHSGLVAAGMLGGEDQREYTVIGDAVNLASRIEGLTKTAGADVLVSEATWALLKGAFTGRALGAHAVKGREQEIQLYAVEGRA